MEFLHYMAKSGGILVLFYSIYLLLLRKETFFETNRTYLLVGIIAAIALPFLTITTTTFVEAPITQFVAISEITTAMPIESVTETSKHMDWWRVVYLGYLLGLSLMIGRFAIQLASVMSLLKKHPSKRVGDYRFVQVADSIAPFSFFKYIVYNPVTHSENELSMILRHEKVHAMQWHSVDLLLANLLRALQWINPIAWLYKKSVEANLEFIADSETATQVASKTEYQLALVKASSPLPVPALTNNFYQSFIKKRIIMLNKSNSNKYNRLKLAMVIPALALFLWSFNTKEVVAYLPAQASTEVSEVATDLTFTSYTTNTKLDAIEAYFQQNHPDAQLQIANRKWDAQKRLIAFKFKTKFKGETSFSTRFSRKSKFKKPFESTYQLAYAPGSTLLVNELGDIETRLSITKENLQFLSPKVTMRPNTPMETKTSNEAKAPKEIRFPISKNSTPEVFKEIKKKLMETHGVELRYIDQRNTKGEINNLEFYFYENDIEIGTLGLGLYNPAPVEASTFFYSPTRHFGFWNASKEAKLKKTQEEKQHYTDSYLEKMNSMVPKTKLKKEDTTSKEIRITFTKNTTLEELEKHKQELKELYDITFNYSDINFNSNGEITGISITFNGKSSNGSYSVYDDQNEPIEDFYYIMDTETGKFKLGRKNTHHRQDGTHTQHQEIARVHGQAEQRRERIAEVREERTMARARASKEQVTTQKALIKERKAVAKVRAKEHANHERKRIVQGVARGSNDHRDSEHSLIIDKDTSDNTLAIMKKNLKAKGIEFDYSKIKRNKQGEITRIKVETNTGNGSKQSIVTNTRSDAPIETVLVRL